MVMKHINILPEPGDLLHVRNRNLLGNRIRAVVGSEHDHDAIFCHDRKGDLCIYNERWPHSHLDLATDYFAKLDKAGAQWCITRPRWVVEAELGKAHPANLIEWRRELNETCQDMEGNYYPPRNLWVVYKRSTKLLSWLPSKPNDKAHFCSAAVRHILLRNREYPWAPRHVMPVKLAAPIHFGRDIRDGDLVVISNSPGFDERIVMVM
jgi:hypothetical protein